MTTCRSSHKGSDVDIEGQSLRRVVEDIRNAIQKLVFPLLDLVTMQIELHRRLASLVVALQGGQCDLRIQCTTVISSWPSYHLHLIVAAKLLE